MEARDIILRPIVTEQSMAGMDNKKYTFEVALHTEKKLLCAVPLKKSSTSRLLVSTLPTFAAKRSAKATSWVTPASVVRRSLL